MYSGVILQCISFIGPVIAPNSDLMFEVELIQIHDGPKPPNVFKLIDIDNDNHLTMDEVSCLWSDQTFGGGAMPFVHFYVRDLLKCT